MESAQLAEEELQQSVVVSEEDMDVEEGLAANSAKEHRSLSVTVSPENHDDLNFSHDNISSADRNEGNAEMGVAANRDEYSVEEDAEGELDDVDSPEPGAIKNMPSGGIHRQTIKGQSDNSTLEETEGDEDGDDDDEGEGVGAVKIKPGVVEDEDEEEDEDDEEDGHRRPESDHYYTSGSVASNESDGAAAWEDALEGDDEDDESEVAASNMCLFCKQGEEHDPGEDFEELLTCFTCGENCTYSLVMSSYCEEVNADLSKAHRQCAREAGALTQSGEGAKWSCPGCDAVCDDPSHDASPRMLPESAESQPEPTLLGGDSDSPSDESRLLRKRKTSTVDTDDAGMALRKRRRKSPEDPITPGSALQSEQSNEADQDQPRKLRLKMTRKDTAVAISRGAGKLMVTLRVSPARLRELYPGKGSASWKRSSRLGGSRSARPPPSTLAPPFMASSLSQPFYSFLDREADEVKVKPYGGILTDIEADTSKTLPTNEDRKRFDEAKQVAEEEWRSTHAAEMHSEIPEKGRKAKKTAGPASQIECIEFGGWEIDTWYAAPYPEEYSRNRVLYICEFCLKYMNSDYVAWRHKLKCPAKHPPGDEIYRYGSVSVFEVDGRKNPVYCQNLCLLAKLFLGSKTLYYDVEPFLFYVLCEHDDSGYHFVGYFSKEKRASSQNNVSCILTLPIHQRKGYGNLLIDFSYLLTRVEKKTGSPEKPLSDMGLVSYRNYWRIVMCQYLLDRWGVTQGTGVASGLSIRQIAADTGLTPDDVISALEGLRCLTRDATTGLYAFRIDMSYCREYLAKWDAKNYVKLNPKALAWTPYVMGRGNATNFELGPAITAIAPREEDEEHKVAITTDSFGGTTEPADAMAAAAGQASGADSCYRIEKDTTNDGVAEDTDIVHGTGGRVRLSTEPHDIIGQGVANDEPGGSGSHSGYYKDERMDWAAAYKDIPASRFEVFPPVSGRRADRPRATIPRPAVLRTASNNARSRRSGGGSIRRASTSSRPKTNTSSRRKTGGTGRGPGRWPKGTKKSDYGNASSGPGLPPGWVKQREKSLGEKDLKVAEVPEDTAASHAMETVRVQFTNSEFASGGSVVPGSTDGLTVSVDPEGKVGQE